MDIAFFPTMPKPPCPLVPLAASSCPSAIGFASGHCRVGSAGGRAYVAGGSDGTRF